MAYCPECGEEVRGGASYCDSCGSSLEGESTEETTADLADPTEDGFNWRHAGAATGFALLPAFAAYMLVSVAAYEAIVPVFLIAIPVFGYLFYQRISKKEMASGMFFWLSIESFILPVAALVYSGSYADAEAATAAEEAGAAIGGGILVILTFVIGIPLGIIFYLVSSRLEPEK